MERDRDEIEAVRAAASDQITQGVTLWRGMTYEQGVENALAWVTGDTDDNPMEDE